PSVELPQHHDHPIKAGTRTQQREDDQAPRLGLEVTVEEVAEQRARQDRSEKFVCDGSELTHAEPEVAASGLPQRAHGAKTSEAASATPSTSASLCASDRKAASNCDGGR